MLRFDHATFQYDTEDFNIVDDLSFEIGQGEFVCLVGASGFGKSTIFRLINKLLPLKSGRILVNGRDIAEQDVYCGYMPQQDLLFPWRTVAENVRLPLEVQGQLTTAEMDDLTAKALEAVGLDGWGGKSPSELSGGMRQRAAFARTTLTGCDLLLLDEPFSALDYLTRLNMRAWLLERWRSERKTIFFITHDVEEAVFLSSRILVAESSPIGELRSVDVDLAYPRSVRTLGEPAAASLKESLIEGLMRSQGEVLAS